VKGDLLGPVMLARIAAAQRALGVPVRVVYTSNAESYFGYNDHFRNAFEDLPIDDRSFILRTINRPHGERADERIWHYQVQPLAHFVETIRLPHIDRMVDFQADASTRPVGGLSLVGF
jgi:hypothetical protein